MIQKIKNIEKAAKRIKNAVKKGERIILYGDSDLDGIASVIILQETLHTLGNQEEIVFFPDREKNGYGINSYALEVLKEKAPALLITLDLGISNIKEVEMANSLGFSVLIIDHHLPPKKLPKAEIIIDPKQASDKYSFKDLANAGLTYKLALEILGKNISPTFKNSLLELAALATIADMVPQIEENKEIIDGGLKSLLNTFRPALRALLEILPPDFNIAIPKMINALNAGELIDSQNESYLFLICPSLVRCREIAQGLINKAILKDQEIENIVKEVKKRISQKPDSPIIFEGDPAWRLTLAGSAAAFLAQEYKKPVFIFRKMNEESCGSVRNPKEKNALEAMNSCRNLLISYGGHLQASGFRIKNENLEKFEKCLIDYFLKKEV